MLLNRFYYHLFGRNERCLEIILCSVAKVLLAVLTKWPTSLTPTITCTRTYYKESIWNPDRMHLDSVPWKKIFNHSIEQIKSNQRKFPKKLLRLSLFALGKCSQRKFPIKKLNHLLHLNIAGVYFAKTHYSSLLMTTLWAAPFLIIISREDENFVRYLVKEAHVLQLPENVGTALHLPQHLTINRVLSSTLCPAFVSELRRVVSNYISNCLYCQKVMARGGKFCPYHHVFD